MIDVSISWFDIIFLYIYFMGINHQLLLENDELCHYVLFTNMLYF